LVTFPPAGYDQSPRHARIWKEVKGGEIKVSLEIPLEPKSFGKIGST
jgi:hypothetical protein